MSGGSFSIFVSRPISLTMVVLFVLFVAGQAFVAMRRARRGPAAAWTV
jgi:TctA family transporter